MRYFWESAAALELACARQAKLEACPHCKRVGTLNRHGWLMGSRPTGSGKDAQRGRRLFCSNRGRRGGCGRTVSLRPAEILKGLRVRTGAMWQFLRRLLQGQSAGRAWEGLEKVFSLESAYRYRRALLQGQQRLRELLCRERAPPLGAAGTLGALLGHLESVFGASKDLIRDFQIRFQEPWPG
jgi:hypothetical protein